MTKIILKPELRTAGGETVSIYYNDDWCGDVYLIYREGDTLTGTIQIDNTRVKERHLNAVENEVRTYIQHLSSALDVENSTVVMMYGDISSMVEMEPYDVVGETDYTDDVTDDIIYAADEMDDDMDELDMDMTDDDIYEDDMLDDEMLMDDDDDEMLMDDDDDTVVIYADEEDEGFEEDFAAENDEDDILYAADDDDEDDIYEEFQYGTDDLYAADERYVANYIIDESAGDNFHLSVVYNEGEHTKYHLHNDDHKTLGMVAVDEIGCNISGRVEFWKEPNEEETNDVACMLAREFGVSGVDNLSFTMNYEDVHLGDMYLNRGEA